MPRKTKRNRKRWIAEELAVTQIERDLLRNELNIAYNQVHALAQHHGEASKLERDNAPLTQTRADLVAIVMALGICGEVLEEMQRSNLLAAEEIAKLTGESIQNVRARIASIPDQHWDHLRGSLAACSEIINRNETLDIDPFGV
jgi:hypothetical protein